MKTKFKIILPILLVSSSVFVLFQVKNDSSKINTSTPISTKSNTLKSTDQTTTPTSFQKLVVQATRCIGCGKCARTDSAHFEMINSVSTVISSTNLNSQNLAIAINNCPVQAITLQ